MVNEAIEVPAEILLKLGTIGRWLSAIGIIVILWLIFQIITLLVNRKKIKQLFHLRQDIERLERKIDNLSKKK